MYILNFFKRNILIIMGILIMFHWVALTIDRISNGITFNLFWISHLVLLLAAIGFILRSNLLLTGSLISILFVHGLWMLGFLFRITTGEFALDYSYYFWQLDLYRKLLTSHHIYLIPLLLFGIWKQKKISIYGWIVASLLFAFSTLFSFFYLSREYNVNCAHSVCSILVNRFSFLGFLNELNPFVYLIFLNLAMILFAFLLPNLLIYWIYGFRKSK